MSSSDVEYLVIICCLILLFALSLSKRPESLQKHFFSIDFNMSMALKGIACVMILMSHWGQRRFAVDIPLGVSKIIQSYAANVALTWFMFLSGYGLSLKHISKEDSLSNLWIKRLGKVYFPLLFTCVICSLCYFILPSVYDLVESKTLWISKDIYYLHHPTKENLLLFLPHLFGWRDWYVLCVMCFYTIFYSSLFLSRKTNIRQTYLLFVLMAFYYVWASFFYGREEAHFYRFCWVFMAGHVAGVGNGNKTVLLLLSFFCLSALFEGKTMCFAFLIAFLSLLGISRLNNVYMVNGKGLLLLGSISYFFYLLHARICYTLVIYMHINSVILWLLFTLIVAYLTWACFFRRWI